MDPEWTKAGKKTNQYLVDFSKWTNEITGGDDVKAGWLNWNPSKVEHWLEGTLGGVASTINKMVKMGETATGKQEFDWQNMLMASRLFKNADEAAEAKRYNSEYWRYYNEYKETQRQARKYEGQETKGVAEAADKLDFLYNSREYGRYLIVDEYASAIKDINDELSEVVDADERKALEAEVAELKKEMIEHIRAYDDAK